MATSLRLGAPCQVAHLCQCGDTAVRFGHHAHAHIVQEVQDVCVHREIISLYVCVIIQSVGLIQRHRRICS